MENFRGREVGGKRDISRILHTEHFSKLLDHRQFFVMPHLRQILIFQIANFAPYEQLLPLMGDSRFMSLQISFKENKTFQCG